MRSLFGLSVTGLLVLGSMAAPSAGTTLVSFMIDDFFPVVGGAGVFSDGGGEPDTNSYHDYRLDPSPPVNWCVEAAPYSAGNLFVRLNRKLDGDAGTMRCTENPRSPGQANGVQRNFVLRISSDQACDILSDPAARLPLTDPAGAAWDEVSSVTPCTLAQNDNPRIRLGTLYKARARSTNIDFLTEMFQDPNSSEYPNSYEIRSESAAPISSDGNHKAVAYSGTFRLVKFEPGQRAKTVGASFAMPVKMDFYQQ